MIRVQRCATYGERSIARALLKPVQSSLRISYLMARNHFKAANCLLLHFIRNHRRRLYSVGFQTIEFVTHTSSERLRLSRCKLFSALTCRMISVFLAHLFLSRAPQIACHGVKKRLRTRDGAEYLLYGLSESMKRTVCMIWLSSAITFSWALTNHHEAFGFKCVWRLLLRARAYVAVFAGLPDSLRFV
jgi:hypothetical protein